MLKRLTISAVLAIVAILGVALESQASLGGRGGLFRRGGGCNSGCDNGGNTGYVAAPIALERPVPPAPIQYEERKVTAYKYVTIDKEIDVVVCKPVTRDEKFFYTVCVPQYRDEVRKVTTYTTQTREVEFKYTVSIPRTVTEVVKQTYNECIRENVTEMVPVCRTVRVSCVDECGRCYTRCERVTVMEPRTRCVTRFVPTTRDVTICKTVFDTQERVGRKTVCDVIPVHNDVNVKICTYVHEKREGVRQVHDIVRENVKQKVQVAQCVPYETVIRVPIANCVNTAYSTGGNDCCDSGYGGGGHGGGRRGLFRR